MDILTSILSKHNIKESFINAKKMDKENRIFISDNFVVKIYYPKKFQYYYNELEVYKNLSNKDYLANLHGYGEEEGYKYDLGPERLHHEIYLSNPQRSKVENLKTVIRVPIRKL